MDIQKITAANIRQIREQKKITLDAAAKLTGVSRSMLAQIEKGAVNPTISVLWKIANGYKVSFTSLIKNSVDSPLVIRGSEVEPLSEDEGRYLNYPVFPFSEETSFETYRIQIEPGGFLAAQPHMAGTEEYITLFCGEVEICVGAEVFHLTQGDSIRFKADVNHSYRNTGETQAYLSMLIYYAGA